MRGKSILRFVKLLEHFSASHLFTLEGIQRLFQELPSMFVTSLALNDPTVFLCNEYRCVCSLTRCPFGTGFRCARISGAQSELVDTVSFEPNARRFTSPLGPPRSPLIM